MQYESFSSKLQIGTSALILLSTFVGYLHFIFDNPRYLFFVGQIAFFVICLFVVTVYKKRMSFDCCRYIFANDIRYACKMNIVRTQILLPLIIVCGIYQYYIDGYGFILFVLCSGLLMVINRFCWLAIHANTPFRVLFIASNDMPFKWLDLLREPINYLSKNHYSRD